MEPRGEPESEPVKDPKSPESLLTAILAPVSLGELLDKITILEIKSEQFLGASLANVQQELQQLQTILAKLPITPDPQLLGQLRFTNRTLWRIEDEIRARELVHDSGETFIKLARSVYQQNDRRSAIKRQLNLCHGSALIEENSYTQY